MIRITTASLAALMASLARAQNSSASGGASVTSIFLPGADVLPYVGSVMGESNGVKTLAISCGPGVDADTCGFPSSVTVRAGPSTAYVSVAIPSATFVYDCKISASTNAVCAETFQGDAAYLATGSGSAAPAGSTSTVTTETLDSTDITYVAVTVTQGGQAAGSAAPVVTSAAAAPPVAPSAAAPAPPAGSSSAAAQQPAASGSAAVQQPAAGSSAAVASAQAPQGSAASWNDWNGGASSASSNSVKTPPAPVATPPASTTTSSFVSQFTGAAEKLGGIGNIAAGLLALAGFAL